MNASTDLIDTPETPSTSKPAAAGKDGEDDPFLSIVIATRNRGEMIVAALRSLFDDEYPSYEIVVVDQSEDTRTSNALLPYLVDDRLRYIRLENGEIVRREKRSLLGLSIDVIVHQFHDDLARHRIDVVLKNIHGATPQHAAWSITAPPIEMQEPIGRG
jgi:hypothetical protein